MSKHNYYKEAELEAQLSQKIMTAYPGAGNGSLPLDVVELSHIPYARNAGNVAPAGQYKDHVGALTRGDDYVSRSAITKTYLPHLAVASAFVVLLFLRR